MAATTWKYTGQSVIGTSHVKTQTPCQDAYAIAMLDDRLVAVVADGAGSAKHAEIGAQLITAEAVALVKAWPPFEDTEAAWQQLMLRLVETLRAKLQAKAAEQNCELKDLAATFLCAIVTGHKIVGGQIGDGAIIYGKEDQADLTLLIPPKRTEYLNETTFLTSDNYLENLQIIYADKGIIDRVAVLSDGLQMLALNMKSDPPEPYQTFFRPFFESLDTVADDAERERHLQAFLASPRVCSRTDDDKTLLFASRQAPPEVIHSPFG